MGIDATGQVRARIGIASPAIAGLSVAALCALCWQISPWLLVFPAAVALFNVAAWLIGSDPGVRALNAHPADPVSDHFLIASVNELADRAGIDPPRVYVSDAADPNAFAARTRSGGLVVVVRSLSDALDEEEMRAVLAHEIGHLKNHDTVWTMVSIVVAQVLFLAVAAFGLILAVAAALGSSTDKRGRSSGEAELGGLIGAAIAAIGYVASLLLQAFSSRRRELLADQTAADLADPVALARALDSLDRWSYGEPELNAGLAMVAPRMFVNPFRDKLWTRLFASHPSMAVRIRKLKARAAQDGQLDEQSFTAELEEARLHRAYEQEHAWWESKVAGLEAKRSSVRRAHAESASARVVQRFGLRRDEGVYATFPAALVETRRRDGQASLRITEYGDAVVTSRGLVYSGSKRVRWDYAKIVHREQDFAGDHEVLVMVTTNRKNTNGLACLSDDGQMSLMVDIAIADGRDGRARLLEEISSELRVLRASAPVRPETAGRRW